MKKLTAALLLSLTMLATPAGAAFAAGQVQASGTAAIIELPRQKIVVEGKQVSFTDVPISSGQRTLLPIRELLVCLGVPNDEDHIIWNNEEKSVTIIKDSVKLYLKAGSCTALINDSPSELDTAPLIYSKNNRFYIPLRFVSQVFGKKTVWDDPSKTILIRDEEEFQSMKAYLAQLESATAALEKCRMGIDISTDAVLGTASISVKSSMTTELDRQQKLMYQKSITEAGTLKTTAERYYSNNVLYTREAAGSWLEYAYSGEEFASLFSSSDFISLVNATDTLAAGLIRYVDESTGEITLKGDIQLERLLEGLSASAFAVDLSRSETAVTIDPVSGRVKSIVMNCEGTGKYNKTEAGIKTAVKVSYSGFEDTFVVSTPAD
jgi:hypothetical protein